MSHRSYFSRIRFLFLVSSLLILFCTAPAHAYYVGDWNIDGYVKSQFGVFTENTKPFNKSEYGGSNDNIATARQQMRWNVNGQLSRSIGIKAEVLAAWEPEYPGERGTGLRANNYSSFDWRELTIEYKPTYSHAIRFGRQIVNWGEAISGRVVDQLNPADARYLLGFTNLEETYMPLWMFRGLHDFYDWNTSFEWIAAPIWQADRHELERRETVAGTRLGDGTMGSTSSPWPRFAANAEGRIEKFSGAEIALHTSPATPGAPASIYGPPFATGYHGTDLVGDSTISPLDAATASALLNAYNFYGIPGATANVRDKNILWTEFPSTDGAADPRYKPDYIDHNFKNTRWGFKTKHMLWGAEVGLSFFQGAAHSGSYHYKYRQALVPGTPLGYLIFEYKIPRYNTYGLFGNYQTPFGIIVFEGAYKPDREFHKNLYGLPAGTDNGPTDVAHQARLGNVAQKDLIHTLLGLTREQPVPFINKNNVITIRAQWQAYWWLEDMDDVVETTTYFTTPPQVNNEFLLSLSTSYSYRKYSPGLTFVFNPRGQIYSSASFTVIPEGFNTRLSISAGYTNIWGANEYSTSTVLAAKNDLAVLTVQYSFY